MSAEPPAQDPRPSDGRAARRPGRPSRDQHRLIAGGVLAVIVAVFAIVNLDQVKVNWIAGTTRSPLILVIAVSLLVGIGLGWVIAAMRR